MTQSSRSFSGTCHAALLTFICKWWAFHSPDRSCTPIEGGAAAVSPWKIQSEINPGVPGGGCCPKLFHSHKRSVRGAKNTSGPRFGSWAFAEGKLQQPRVSGPGLGRWLRVHGSAFLLCVMRDRMSSIHISVNGSQVALGQPGAHPPPALILCSAGPAWLAMAIRRISMSFSKRACYLLSRLPWRPLAGFSAASRWPAWPGCTCGESGVRNLSVSAIVIGRRLLSTRGRSLHLCLS